MRLADLNVGDIDFHDRIGRRQDDPLNRAFAKLVLWRARTRQRAELAHLDGLLRQDIGITDADVWRETRKAPWQT